MNSGESAKSWSLALNGESSSCPYIACPSVAVRLDMECQSDSRVRRAEEVHSPGGGVERYLCQLDEGEGCERE